MPMCVRLTCVRGHVLFVVVPILEVIVTVVIVLQVNALLETLESKESVQRKGHLGLYNCFVLGNTMHNDVQRVYCNPFPAKPLYGSHRLDLVMIRPPGIENVAFVVTPDSVWYARVLLLFSAPA